MSREAIVQVALKLLNEVGFEKLSTRLLARKLGIQQPSLYHHFASKRALADALASVMIQSDSWPGPHTPESSPEEWLAERGHALRNSLLAYRDGALVHAGTSPETSSYHGLEERLDALVAYGFTLEDALRTLLAVSRYTVGWVLEQQAQHERVEGREGLKPDPAYPKLAKAVTRLNALGADANYDYGLRSLIRGAMEQRQDEARPTKTSQPRKRTSTSRTRGRPGSENAEPDSKPERA